MFYYIQKHLGLNALAVLFSVIRWGIQISHSVLKIQMFAGIIALDWQKTLFWFALDLAAYLVNYVFVDLATYFRARATRAMNNHVRRDMTASLLAMPYGDFHATQSGEKLSWYTANIQQIERLAWEPFYSLIDSIAQAAWGILALSSLHWSLVAAAMISTGIFLLTPKLFQKKIESLGEGSAAGLASATAQMKELLGGFDVLRLFGRTQSLRAGMDSASDTAEAPECRRKTIQGITRSLLDVIVTLCGMGMVLWTAYLSVKGTIIVTALSGASTLMNWVTNGLSELGDIQLSFSAAKPFFANVTVHADEAGKKPASPMPPVTRALDLENVSFSYGDKQMLNSLSLQFEIGKKYALIGASGCGKSTVLKLLLGWLPGYSGEIRFDGCPAREYTPEQVQEQMSYIEQDVFLFNATIRENITLGEEFSQAEMDRAVRDSALIGDLAAMPLGLDTPVGENGRCLSGGQKQRVAIARALIHRRSILLVDEGTSALDQANADLVEQSLLQNPDLTLILVSHHLSEERKAQFDRVYEL